MIRSILYLSIFFTQSVRAIIMLSFCFLRILNNSTSFFLLRVLLCSFLGIV